MSAESPDCSNCSSCEARIRGLEEGLEHLRHIIMTQSGTLIDAINRYKKGKFIFNPTAEYPSNTLRLLDETIHNKNTDDAPPFLSIVIPVHNQAEIIEKTLDALILNTVNQTYEIILIFDACSDDTAKVVLDWLDLLEPPTNLLRTVIFESTMPLFETAADNLGFYCARGEYVLEVQADIEVVELGYNLKLHEPFKHMPNLIGVSGRGCHSFLRPEAAGRISHYVEYPLPREFPRNLVFISETCIRGPLLLHRPKLVEMGFLDEKHFFLDSSDHDLFMRAYEERGWICGYTPVDYVSRLAHGSTRKPRDALNQEHYERKKAKYEATADQGKFEIYLQQLQKREEAGIVREIEAFEFPYTSNNLPTTTYSQIGQDTDVIDLFRRKRGGFFLDIGAYDGWAYSNSYILEKSFAWRGICVEPQPAEYEKLCKIRTCSTSNKAVFHTSDQIVEFTVDHMLSGISDKIDCHTYINGPAAKKIEVQTTTPSDLLEAFDAPRIIDYMSLDTEGSELDILRAFDFTKYTVKYLNVEHNDQEPRRTDMRTLLESNGFIYLGPNKYDDDYLHRSFLEGSYAAAAAAAEEAAEAEPIIYQVEYVGNLKLLTITCRRSENPAASLQASSTVHTATFKAPHNSFELESDTLGTGYFRENEIVFPELKLHRC